MFQRLIEWLDGLARRLDSKPKGAMTEEEIQAVPDDAMVPHCKDCEIPSNITWVDVSGDGYVLFWTKCPHCKEGGLIILHPSELAHRISDSPNWVEGEPKPKDGMDNGYL